MIWEDGMDDFWVIILSWVFYMCKIVSCGFPAAFDDAIGVIQNIMMLSIYFIRLNFSLNI